MTAGRTARGDEKLRAFVNALPDLLFVLDEDGRYIEALTSNEDLFYLKSSELVGRRMHDVLPREKADLFLRTVRRTLSTRKSQVLEYELTVPAGIRYFEGRTSPLNATLRGRRMIVWVSRDVTERRQLDLRLRAQISETRRAYGELKRAQSKLVRSEKFASIGMLVAGVAHEVNNPLSVIYGNLHLLTAGRKPSGLAAPKSGRMLRDALRAAEQIRAVLVRFRTFARDGRPSEFVDLNSCVEAVLRSLGRAIPPRIRVVRRLGRVPRVRCFPDQIHQALLNLVRNAAEAIDGRGVITLRTRRGRGCVVVEIADTGPGIRANQREKIFEPFYTTKPEGRGLGLGLSISAMIVDHHNGGLSFASRGGRGTVFRVTLPTGQ